MTPELSPRFTARARVAALFSLAAASALVAACGGGDDSPPRPLPAPATGAGARCADLRRHHEDGVPARREHDGSARQGVQEGRCLDARYGDDAGRDQRRVPGQAQRRPWQSGPGERAVDVGRHRHRDLAAQRSELEPEDPQHGRRRLGRGQPGFADGPRQQWQRRPRRHRRARSSLRPTLDTRSATARSR